MIGTLTVHPRVCGEHTALCRLVAVVDGSSPRLRGTQQQQVARLRSRRFIPASAGNTDGSSTRSRELTVHPRVCGEHVIIEWGGLWQTGSSPRLRGTPGTIGRAGR